MAAPYASPTAQHLALTLAFLALAVRPCGCPLELREEREGLRCATCDRPFLTRSTGAK